MPKTNDKEKKDAPLTNSRWIKMNTGVKIIIGTSIVMAVLTGVQTIPALGWLEGSLWALGFGLMIWVIFYGLIFINKVLRR
jgi:hypothetical protein